MSSSVATITWSNPPSARTAAAIQATTIRTHHRVAALDEPRHRRDQRAGEDGAEEERQRVVRVEVLRELARAACRCPRAGRRATVSDEDDQRAAEDVEDRRHRPEPREREPGAAVAAVEPRDRDEEVLGEELAAADDEEDEADAERDRAEDVRGVDAERPVRQVRRDERERDDARDDVEPGRERRRDDLDERPLEPALGPPPSSARRCPRAAGRSLGPRPAGPRPARAARVARSGETPPGSARPGGCRRGEARPARTHGSARGSAPGRGRRATLSATSSSVTVCAACSKCSGSARSWLSEPVRPPFGQTSCAYAARLGLVLAPADVHHPDPRLVAAALGPEALDDLLVGSASTIRPSPSRPASFAASGCAAAT